MAGQLLESKHNLLQARVEHLELDLGFKAPKETGWWRCVILCIPKQKHVMAINLLETGCTRWIPCFRTPGGW